MTAGFQTVDVWIGRFPSRRDFDAYLAEHIHDDDNRPISRFAADQNQPYYDHDLVEGSFKRSTSNVANLLMNHSYAGSYLQMVQEAFHKSGVRAANTIILGFDAVIKSPCSLESGNLWLTYLGRFEILPEPATGAGDSGPPDAIYLLLEQGKQVVFNGQAVSSIPVDSRGLVIGRGLSESSIPRLDISQFEPEVAVDQVKVYQDQFDQWVIENLSTNGLTWIGNEPLEGRTFPWPGKRRGLVPCI